MEASFQSYFQQCAEQKLTTFNRISMLIERPEYQYLTPDEAYEIGHLALLLVQHHAQVKSRIPSESKWFRHTPVYENWLLLGGENVDFYLTHGVAPQPKEVPDHSWVERELSGAIARSARSLLRSGNEQSAAKIASEITVVLRGISYYCDVLEAVRLLRTLDRETINPPGEPTGVSSLSSTLNSRNPSRAYDMYADVVHIGLTDIILGLVEQSQVSTMEWMSGLLKQINWIDRSTLYTVDSKVGMPRQMVQKLEGLQARMENEFKIEGRFITPAWYQNGVASIGYLEYLKEAIKAIHDCFEDVYVAAAEELVERGLPFMALNKIHQGLQVYAKLKGHMEMFPQKITAFVSAASLVYMPVPTIEWEELKTRRELLYKRMIAAVAKTTPVLLKAGVNENVVDEYGFACLLLARQCFNALESGDDELFASLFPSYFILAINGPRRLSTMLPGDSDGRFMAATETIEDLLELSGHAIAFSELNGKPFHRIVGKLWSNYLAAESAAKVDSIVKERNSIRIQSLRETMRIEWRRKLTDRIEEFIPVRRWAAYESETERSHPSPVVRALAKHLNGRAALRNLFLAHDLYKRPEFGGLELPREASWISEVLEKESGKQNQGEEATDEA